MTVNGLGLYPFLICAVLFLSLLFFVDEGVVLRVVVLQVMLVLEGLHLVELKREKHVVVLLAMHGVSLPILEGCLDVDEISLAPNVLAVVRVVVVAVIVVPPLLGLQEEKRGIVCEEVLLACCRKVDSISQEKKGRGGWQEGRGGRGGRGLTNKGARVSGIVKPER